MTTKQEALKRLDELERKVEKLNVEKEKAEALGVQIANDLNAAMAEKDKAERRRLDAEAEVGGLRRKLEGFAMLSEALGKIRGDQTPVDVDALAERLLPKVLERLPVGGEPRFVPVPPKEALLKTFMQAEVSRLEERLKGLPLETRKIVSYLHAKGTNSSKADIITHVFGQTFTSGDRYGKVSKFIDEAVVTELVRKDTAGRHFSNIEKKVEEDMKPYSASQEEVQEVVDRVVYLLAQGITDQKPEE